MRDYRHVYAKEKPGTGMRGGPGCLWSMSGYALLALSMWPVWAFFECSIVNNGAVFAPTFEYIAWCVRVEARGLFTGIYCGNTGQVGRKIVYFYRHR